MQTINKDKRKKRSKATRKKQKITPRVKDILKLLQGGTKLAAYFAIPTITFAAAPFLASRKKLDWVEYEREWRKYNPWRLRQALKRLREQKMIEIVEEEGIKVVKLTQRGKQKILKYNMEEMALKIPHRWDKKWRIVIYDIPTNKKGAAEVFRDLLQSLKFLMLQKSVYLTPFPCEDEIKYLREYFDIGENVVLLTVDGLENETPYRQYFGI